MPKQSLGTFKKVILFSFLIPVSVALYLLVYSHQTEIKINCDIQHSSCTQQLSGSSITLNILPKPVVAMRDLTFQVKIAGHPITSNPYIDLNMPAMDMGRNYIELKAVDDGVYEGTGVLVRCPSGITTWHALITIPGKGTADYTFDVVY